MKLPNLILFCLSKILRTSISFCVFKLLSKSSFTTAEYFVKILHLNTRSGISFLSQTVFFEAYIRIVEQDAITSSTDLMKLTVFDCGYTVRRRLREQLAISAIDQTVLLLSIIEACATGDSLAAESTLDRIRYARRDSHSQLQQLYHSRWIVDGACK